MDTLADILPEFTKSSEGQFFEKKYKIQDPENIALLQRLNIVEEMLMH